MREVGGVLARTSSANVTPRRPRIRLLLILQQWYVLVLQQPNYIIVNLSTPPIKPSGRHRKTKLSTRPIKPSGRHLRTKRGPSETLTLLSPHTSPDTADRSIVDTVDCATVASPALPRASARIHCPSDEKSILVTPPLPPSPMHCGQSNHEA